MLKRKLTIKEMNLVVRKRAFQVLDEAYPGDKLSLGIDYLLQFLILGNVFAVLLGSVEDIRDDILLSLHYFEMLSVIIFTIEYSVRVWACVEDERYQQPFRGRLRYIFSPLALIDLIAIVPFYFVFLNNDLRLLRMIRLLKIMRYSHGLRSIALAIYSRRHELITTLFIFLVALVFVSFGMYFAEKEAQPEAFSSIPASMWWGIVTLTTLGYGDVVPITTLGKLIGAMSALVGIGMYALPSGILVSGFLEQLEIHRQKKISQHRRNE